MKSIFHAKLHGYWSTQTNKKAETKEKQENLNKKEKKSKALEGLRHKK